MVSWVSPFHSLATILLDLREHINVLEELSFP